jgi:L-alanine-DL-glutamate epimerase-like enolase superfamily enzyme
MVASLIIDQVEAVLCRVPLETPVDLGSITVRSRDFLLLRVRTADGIEGVAYALTRGAPTDLVVTDLLAPILVGKDALDIDTRVDEMRRAMVTLGPVGIVGRAISLLEVCLWDIKAKAAEEPVWRTLGGSGEAADVLLVAPYAGPDETDDAYAERLAPLAAKPYSIIKLYPLADADAMAKRLAVLRRAFGDDLRLAIDMAWLWRTSEESIDAVRRWEEYDLTWVEDPHVADDASSIKALRDAVQTPIAVGDEVSVRAVTETLIREGAVDVLRLDATTIGGFTVFAEIRELARASGLRTSPHAYGEIHRHAVHAWPDVGPVEVFPPKSPSWGVSRFLEELELPDGAATIEAPTEPGLGLHIDWTAATDLALRVTRT